MEENNFSLSVCTSDPIPTSSSSHKMSLFEQVTTEERSVTLMPNASELLRSFVFFFKL